MITNIIIVAKGVIKNRQRLSALEYALKETNPDTYLIYKKHLDSLEKDFENDMHAFDDLIDKLERPKVM